MIRLRNETDILLADAAALLRETVADGHVRVARTLAWLARYEDPPQFEHAFPGDFPPEVDGRHTSRPSQQDPLNE